MMHLQRKDWKNSGWLEKSGELIVLYMNINYVLTIQNFEMRVVQE